jgi:transcriptional regulator with XRE-family HTH domain
MRIKNKNFYIRLRFCRLARGITQKDLAEKIGITPATISAYENLDSNKRKNPTFDKGIEMARALNVSLDWLGGLSDENGVEI